MNNHGIICKNNIMIIFFIIFVIFILILLNKKIKLNIDFSIIGFEYNFCISINYFFDLITIYKEDFAKYRNKYRKTISTPNIKPKKWALEYIDVERINFELKFGLDDIFVTSMFVPVISSIIAIGMQKFLPEASKNFSVKPIYNKFFLSLKGAMYVSIKPKDIIYIVFRILKEKIKERIKNKKTSNIIFDKDFAKTQ